MGQHGADVSDEGPIARVPQAPGQGRCGQHADRGKRGLRPVGQAVDSSGAATPARPPRRAVFNACKHPGNQNEERRPHHEGVVLLVGRNRKEDQREGREQAQQPDGAHAELDVDYVAGHIEAGGVVEVEIHRVARVGTQML